MENERQDGDRITVKAAATGGAKSGVPIIEKGFHGFPVDTVSQNEWYALNISQKVFEIAETLVETAKPEGGFKMGEDVYINESPAEAGHTAFKLQIVAHKASAPAKSTLLGRITATPTETADPGETTPPTGNLYVKQAAGA